MRASRWRSPQTAKTPVFENANPLHEHAGAFLPKTRERRQRGGNFHSTYQRIVRPLQQFNHAQATIAQICLDFCPAFANGCGFNQCLSTLFGGERWWLHNAPYVQSQVGWVAPKQVEYHTKQLLETKNILLLLLSQIILPGLEFTSPHLPSRLLPGQLSPSRRLSQ